MKMLMDSKSNFPFWLSQALLHVDHLHYANVQHSLLTKLLIATVSVPTVIDSSLATSEDVFSCTYQLLRLCASP